MVSSYNHYPQEDKKEEKQFFCEDLEEVIKKKDEEIARLHDMLNIQKSFEKISSLKNEEFEFKYLVKGSYYDEIKEKATHSTTRVQGYFPIFNILKYNFSEVRVSKRSDRDYGLITIKTQRVLNHRLEYHSRMDGTLALELIHQLPSISKDRYYLNHDGYDWVVDFFHKENAGLVMAEIEFNSEEEMLEFHKKDVYPKWVDLDVTDDERFYNYWLAVTPWPTWPENNRGGVKSWWRNRFQQIWL